MAPHMTPKQEDAALKLYLAVAFQGPTKKKYRSTAYGENVLRMNPESNDVDAEAALNALIGKEEAAKLRGANLAHVARMSAVELGDAFELSPKAAKMLVAAFGVAQAAVNSIPLHGETISQPSILADLFRTRLALLPQEEFWLVLVDVRNIVLRSIMVRRGGHDTVAVDVRAVLRYVLNHRAHAFFIVHNHPSGIADASRADRELTTRLKASASAIDVRMLDHVVVATGGWFSVETGTRRQRKHKFPGDGSWRQLAEDGEGRPGGAQRHETLHLDDVTGVRLLPVDQRDLAHYGAHH